ncbi:MAG TPA: GNAT family N-acetyltransferase [Byssovorax sp.]
MNRRTTAHRREEPSTRESARLWGLDWDLATPWTFDGVDVVMGTFDDATPFVEAHYPGIFTAHGTKFLADEMTAAKRRFAAGMDVFLCRADGGVVGVFMGHPLDWSSYYMRSAALLPQYRDRRVLTRLVEAMYAPLRAAGVERMEGDVAPTNLPMMKMLTGLGWIPGGTLNSERWGSTVRFVKYLREEAEDVFARQFCGMRVKSFNAREQPPGAE